PQRGGEEVWEPGWKGTEIKPSGASTERTRPAAEQARPTASSARLSKALAAKPALTPEADSEAVDIAPEFATATMGTILLAQGRVREALAVFERALARDPADAQARRGVETCRATLAGDITEEAAGD